MSLLTRLLLFFFLPKTEICLLTPKITSQALFCCYFSLVIDSSLTLNISTQIAQVDCPNTFILQYVIMKFSSYERIEQQSLGGYVHTLSFQLPCFNTLSNKLSCNLISHTSNRPGNCFRDMTGTGQVKGKVIICPLKIISFMFKIYFGFKQAFDALNKSRYISFQDDPFTVCCRIQNMDMQ